MAYKEGQLLGFAKNGSPIYMAASAEQGIDLGIVAGSVLVIGLLGALAMIGIMAGESKKRKKIAPRMRVL